MTNPESTLVYIYLLTRVRKSINKTNTSGQRAHSIMNTESRVDGKVTTLRPALHPIVIGWHNPLVETIVKLAAQVDTPSGCSVYKLVQRKWLSAMQHNLRTRLPDCFTSPVQLSCQHTMRVSAMGPDVSMYFLLNARLRSCLTSLTQAIATVTIANGSQHRGN